MNLGALTGPAAAAAAVLAGTAAAATLALTLDSVLPPRSETVFVVSVATVAPLATPVPAASAGLAERCLPG